MTRKERTAHAKMIQARKEKAMRLLAVTVVVIGAYTGLILDYHYHGFAIEVIGLYLVELV